MNSTKSVKKSTDENCNKKQFFNFTLLLFSMIVLIALSASPVWAANGLALKDYRRFKKAVPEVNSYLSGMGHGYFHANAYAERLGHEKIYCQPYNIVLDADDYIKILDNEIKQGNNRSEDVVEIIMIKGLRRIFPC